nr:Gag-Pol polyprotein [Tanacetum cinerariifolium]
SSVRTRSQLANSCLFSCLLSSIEPANVAKALRDANWVSAMQEELDQFARLKVWRLVPRPEGKFVIKTKWIFKNKKDESSLVIRNKARLVEVGYSQKKGLIMMRRLHMSLESKLYACSWHMLLIRISLSIK